MFPDRLCTERLTLRVWTDADLAPLVKIFAVKAVWEFPYGRGWTHEETTTFLGHQQEIWRTRGFGLWAAELRETGQLIGFIGLSGRRSFLRCCRRSKSAGVSTHGIGDEAWQRRVVASIEQGYVALGLDRIVSIAEPGNAHPSVSCASSA